MQHVALYGNLRTGFTAAGPFPSAEDAQLWLDDCEGCPLPLDDTGAQGAFVVVHGSLPDGFHATGPFPDFREAEAWCGVALRDWEYRTAWIAPLVEP
jgi:hypothetical protein